MTKLADMLATLNTLRAASGKPALKGWKNSIAELEQRIKDETPASSLGEPRTTTSTPVSPDLADIIAADAGKTPVTTLPPAPELQKVAKRKAIIGAIADKAVKTDTPTTVIDAKAAARQLRKVGKKAKKPTVTKKVVAKVITTGSGKKVAIAKKPSDDSFAKLLAELGITGKVARAKLRRAKVAKVDGHYVDNADVRKALKEDKRTK